MWPRGKYRVRHVQVVTDPSRASRQTERAIPVSGVPGWFVQLVAPPPEALPRIVLFGHTQTQNLVIEADPADEIRKAWEEVRTFLWFGDSLGLDRTLGLSARRYLRGRDVGYPAPPAQTRTCSFPASGSSVVLASAMQGNSLKQTPADAELP